MRILALIEKDVSQILRDRQSLLFLLLMPLVFTGFMGFALRQGGNQDTRLPVGLVIGDNGALGGEIERMIATSSAIRPVDLEEISIAEAAGQVRTGKLAAAIVLPSGASQKAMKDETPRLSLIVDTANPAGFAARQAAEGAIMRLLGAAQAANLTVQQVESQHPFPSVHARQAAWAQLVAAASKAWQEKAIDIQVESGIAGSQTQTPSSFAQSSPGMMVQFAIFGLITSSMILVLERKTRTLQRMLTTDLPRSAIILGHLMAMFVITFTQGVILVLAGQLLFGVDYLRAPFAILGVLVALALWVSSLGLLIGTLAKSEDQVVLFSMAAMFIFSALGGVWFTLEGVSGAFAFVGRLTPGAWAMLGFQNIVVRGLESGSVLAPIAALMLYALAFFLLAVWKFKSVE